MGIFATGWDTVYVQKCMQLWKWWKFIKIVKTARLILLWRIWLKICTSGLDFTDCTVYIAGVDSMLTSNVWDHTSLNKRLRKYLTVRKEENNSVVLLFFYFRAHLDSLVDYCKKGVEEGATLVYGGKQLDRPGWSNLKFKLTDHYLQK